MNLRRSDFAIVLCGCVVMLYLCAITAYGQTSGTMTQEKGKANAHLLHQPQYAATVQSLEARHRFYQPDTTRGGTSLRQDDVDAMLFLRTMPKASREHLPYLYSVLVTRHAGIRLLVIKWLGDDQAIPRLEVIGRGGRVVGTFAGIVKCSYGFSDRDWFRSLMLFPIINGEQDTNVLDERGIKMRLDIDGLRDIEGIRLLPSDDSPPRFVRAYFGNEAILAEVPATTQPGSPGSPGMPPPPSLPLGR